MKRAAVALIAALCATLAQGSPYSLVQPLDGVHALLVLPGLDFTSQVNGITFAVKAVWYPAEGNLGDVGCCYLYILERVDNEWTISAVIDSNYSAASIAAAGGPAQYVATVVQPAITAWANARASAPQLPINTTSLQFVNLLHYP